MLSYSYISLQSRDHGPFSLSLGRDEDVWVNNPGYIDGAANPPVMYYSQENIEEGMRLAAHYGIHPQREPSPASDHASPSPAPGGSQAPPASQVVPPAGASGQGGDDEAPEHQYNINAVRSFTTMQPATGKAGDRGKMVAKKDKLTKTFSALLDSISRGGFITAFLAAHSLDMVYSPGINHGPDFKLSWTGSAGGASNATTISNDTDFRLAVDEIKKKPKKTCKILVQFDTSTMQQWHVQTPGSVARSGGNLNDSTADAPELQFGDRVPTEDSFTAEEMLHGKNIRELKTLHACQTHLGEHGELGCCYVGPDGVHTKLNNRKLKLWAAAWAAGTATKHEPPNTVEFDGFRDGTQAVRPRGRTGPRPAQAAQLAAPNNNPGVADIFGLLAAAVVPAIIPMLQDMIAGTSRRRRASSSDAEDQPVPKRRRSDGMPRLTTRLVEHTPASMPSELGELDPCFAAFERERGYTLEAFIVHFARRSLTPDVIPLVPIKLLEDTTEYDVPQGILKELQQFCKDWVNKAQAEKGDGWVMVDEHAGGGSSGAISRPEASSSKTGGSVNVEDEEDDFEIVDGPDAA